MQKISIAFLICFIGIGCFLICDRVSGKEWISYTTRDGMVDNAIRCITVDGKKISEIGAGLLVLLGVSHDDTPFDARHLARKTVNLRIFDDPDDKMNLSVRDVGGQVLAVSQFTLYGDCTKRNRPSYIHAARPEQGETLFNEYVQALETLGFPAQTGKFGADMKVELLNDGPVTLILESTGRTKE